MKKLLLTFTLLLSSVFSANVALAAPVVEFETTLGNFTVELNEEKAPISVANFMRYVEDGSYVGTIFHRVIPGFMAQGGGFNENMQQITTYEPIKNEATNGLANATATIAMARTNDPNSATRQFFINLVDNDFLNPSTNSAGYAVFGKVTEGFDVVEAMATKPTKAMGGMKDIPVTPIVITKVTVK